MSQNPPSKVAFAIPRWAWLAAIAAILFFLCFPYLLLNYVGYFPGNNTLYSNWGEIGDYIGGVLGTIFALGAVAAVIYTIYEQKKELREDRKILLQQSRTLAEQQFESTFFSLIVQHEARLNRMHAEDVVRKSKPFVNLYCGLFGEFSADQNSSSSFDYKAKLEELNGIAGPYFIYLFQILKFLFLHERFSNKGERKELPEDIEKIDFAPSKEEKMFSNLIRASIDTATLHLLVINCGVFPESKSKLHFPQYKFLLEFYGFFEHMWPVEFDVNGDIDTFHERANSFAKLCDSFNYRVWGKNVWIEDILPIGSENLKRVIDARDTKL